MFGIDEFLNDYHEEQINEGALYFPIFENSVLVDELTIPFNGGKANTLERSISFGQGLGKKPTTITKLDEPRVCPRCDTELKQTEEIWRSMFNTLIEENNKKMFGEEAGETSDEEYISNETLRQIEGALTNNTQPTEDSPNKEMSQEELQKTELFIFGISHVLETLEVRYDVGHLEQISEYEIASEYYILEFNIDRKILNLVFNEETVKDMYFVAELTAAMFKYCFKFGWDLKLGQY